MSTLWKVEQPKGLTFVEVTQIQQNHIIITKYPRNIKIQKRGTVIYMRPSLINVPTLWEKSTKWSVWFSTISILQKLFGVTLLIDIIWNGFRFYLYKRINRRRIEIPWRTRILRLNYWLKVHNAHFQVIAAQILIRQYRLWSKHNLMHFCRSSFGWFLYLRPHSYDRRPSVWFQK